MTSAVDVASVNGVGTNDAGVTPGLLTRNFTQADDLFDSKLQQVPWSEATWRERKERLMTAREQLADLAHIQACRPLGRPGSKQWSDAMSRYRAGV